MTPMAFLFASLFAVVVLLPVTAVWMGDRLGLLARSLKKPQIIEFPHWAIHTHHRHSDAA